MDDLISRQAAKNKKVYSEERHEYVVPVAELDWLPPAQPEQRWIPCSERLPEDDTLMLVNYVDHGQYAMDIWIGWHEMENVWYIDGETHSEEFGNEVIAWMPINRPEPWRGGQDETN